MDSLFGNNSFKGRIIFIALVILALISATFLINAFIIFLAVGIVVWALYKCFQFIKGYFSIGRRKGKSEVIKADIVNINLDFTDLSSNKNIIDVEYTEV